MRVLLFSHSSAVDNLGGAERSLLELIDTWNTADPAVTFFVIARSPAGLLQGELDDRGVQWMVLPFTSTVVHRLVTEPGALYDFARTNFAAVRAIERFIAEYRPNLVLTNTIVAPWAAIAARLCPTPHVWYVHEYGDGHEFQVPRDDVFTDIGLLSDLVVTSSESLREFVSQWVPAELITVAYPAVSIPTRPSESSQRIPWPLPSGIDRVDLRVVCVARIMPSKGQARLVHAVARLRDEGISVELVLVGSAEESHRRELVTLVTQLDVGHLVAMTGELENPAAIVDQADVGVVASDSEGFGRVTVEYMLAGKPVVGPAAGATPELVADGRTGRIFSLDDEASLADALREYARDRGSIATHGAAAARVAQEDIILRHIMRDAVEKMSKVARSEVRPLDRLPAILNSWFVLPELVVDLLLSPRAMVDPSTSRTWQLGRAILWLPRRVKRVVIGQGSAR